MLGNGTSTGSDRPVRVLLPAGTKVTTLAGGRSLGLALTTAGQVLGWGDQEAVAQLGDGLLVGKTVTVTGMSFKLEVGAGGDAKGLSEELAREEDRLIREPRRLR